MLKKICAIGTDITLMVMWAIIIGVILLQLV